MAQAIAPRVDDDDRHAAGLLAQRTALQAGTRPAQMINGLTSRLPPAIRTKPHLVAGTAPALRVIASGQ